MTGIVSSDRLEIGLSGQQYTLKQGTNGLEVWRGPADAPVALIETIDLAGKPHASWTYSGSSISVHANVGNALSPAGNVGTFTAPSAGNYLVTATALGDANGRCVAFLSVRGANPSGWPTLEFLDTIGSLASSLNASGSHVVTLAAGDTLNVQTSVSNAGNTIAVTVTKL